jgi:hypothetical protein
MGQWTLDNAGSCNTAMEKVQRCCAKEGIVFDADGNRIRYVVFNTPNPQASDLLSDVSHILLTFPHRRLPRNLRKTHLWLCRRQVYQKPQRNLTHLSGMNSHSLLTQLEKHALLCQHCALLDNDVQISDRLSWMAITLAAGLCGLCNSFEMSKQGGRHYLE